MDKVAEQNVRLSMKRNPRQERHLELLGSGTVRLVGGMYDLKTGIVTFYD